MIVGALDSSAAVEQKSSSASTSLRIAPKASPKRTFPKRKPLPHTPPAAFQPEPGDSGLISDLLDPLNRRSLFVVVPTPSNPTPKRLGRANPSPPTLKPQRPCPARTAWALRRPAPRAAASVAPPTATLRRRPSRLAPRRRRARRRRRRRRRDSTATSTNSTSTSTSSSTSTSTSSIITPSSCTRATPTAPSRGPCPWCALPAPAPLDAQSRRSRPRGAARYATASSARERSSAPTRRRRGPGRGRPMQRRAGRRQHLHEVDRVSPQERLGV
jgi:hypothetical protein